MSMPRLSCVIWIDSMHESIEARTTDKQKGLNGGKGHRQINIPT